MEGVQRRYQGEVEKILSQLVSYYPAVIIGAIPGLSKSVANKIGASLAKAAATTFENLISTLSDYRQVSYWRPVIDVVAVLPKDELADMAETFVNLSSFRHKVSMEVESVGGPVDVAVISKGDGFVWIKRKTYFDLATNPHVLSRYLR
jgi:hypothetical protein